MSAKYAGYQANFERVRSTAKVSSIYSMVSDRNAPDKCHNGSGSIAVQAKNGSMPVRSNEANWDTCPVKVSSKVAKVSKNVELFYVKNGKPSMTRYSTIAEAMQFGATCDSFQVVFNGKIVAQGKS